MSDATTRYDSLFQYFASRDGHSWQLLKRQAFIESSLNPDAYNEKSGCKGLCQFKDDTFAEWSTNLKIPNASVWDPEDSINCQSSYLKWLMQQFPADSGQTVRMALASYNFGIKRVKRGDPWPKETVDYVNKILSTISV